MRGYNGHSGDIMRYIHTHAYETSIGGGISTSKNGIIKITHIYIYIHNYRSTLHLIVRRVKRTNVAIMMRIISNDNDNDSSDNDTDNDKNNN